MIRQTLGKPKDYGRTVNGKINHGMTGPGTSPRRPMQPKEKERKVKEKGKSGKDGKDGKSGSKDGTAQLADAAQSSTTTATTCYNHINLLNFSFMATTEEQTSCFSQEEGLPQAFCQQKE